MRRLKGVFLFVNSWICHGSLATPWRNQKQDFSFQSFAYLMSLAAFIIAVQGFLQSYLRGFMPYCFCSLEQNSAFYTFYFYDFVALVWLFMNSDRAEKRQIYEHLILYMRYSYTCKFSSLKLIKKRNLQVYEMIYTDITS